MQQTRHLLSDAFLHGAIASDSRFNNKNKVHDPSWIYKLMLRYKVRGLDVLTKKDLLQLATGLTSNEDLELMCKLILECLDNNPEKIPSIDTYLASFLLHCLTKGNSELARRLWCDPVFKQSLWHTHESLRNIYFTILYRNRHYQELSDEIMAMISNGGISTMVEPSLDNTRPSSNSIWTKSIVRTVPYATGVVGMAAVAKLHVTSGPSTSPPLRNAGDLWYMSSDSKQGRIAALYAWAALQTKEYNLAYDVISKKVRKGGMSPDLSCNLKLAILTDLKRLDAAADVIRSDVLREENKSRNLRISREVFSVLGDAVKSASDVVLRDTFFRLSDAMNEYAGLESKSLEEMVFEEVDPQQEEHFNGSYPGKGIRERTHKRKMNDFSRRKPVHQPQFHSLKEEV